MISANYIRNACVKNKKKITFFIFEINKHQCLNTPNLYLKSLSLGEFFSPLKGGGCLVKLVAAKLIRQHMFFFT